MNQLTFLYNILCQTLDANKEIRIVFCEINKAFGRVWHAVYYVNSKLLVSLGNFLIGPKTTYLTEDKQKYSRFYTGPIAFSGF